MSFCIKMVKLDKIDKKIIYELGKNSRQSYKKIAQNNNSKKEIVAYRIKRLQNEGVITKYVPVFALSSLNIFSSKIYLRLQGLDEKSEKEMYQSLVNNPNICWVAKTVGRWDLLLGMYTKNHIDFSRIKNQIISDFGKYIKEYDITMIEDGLVFNRDHLVGKRVSYRNHFVFGGEAHGQSLDCDEKKIVELIRNNGRFESAEIARKLGVDSRTVINKVKSLEKRKILQGFTVFLDLRKINFNLHKLCIHLQHYERKKVEKLISFLKANPNTVHLIKSLGSWELEVEVETDYSNNIYDYVNELKNKFPETIKQIDLVTITDELKLDFFPENYEEFFD